MEDGRLAARQLTTSASESDNIPIMHECYQLGIINHDTIASLVRFCLKFWMGHYRMQQFEMSQQQEIEQEEKKKLAAIIAEKEAWEKNGTIPPRE
jgi:hypothetical protein